MFKNIIPFFYTFKYNRKGVEGIAYFLEYQLLLLLFSYTFSSFDIVFLLKTFLLLVGLTLVYEIGYIENNTVAIQYEENPTLRHSKEEIKSIKKNYFKIKFWRYLILLFIIIVMTKLFSIKEVVVFILLLVLVRITYYEYNLVYRNGLKNRILFFILRFLRYYIPIFFIGKQALELCLIISFLNLINNFSWYKRSKISLPKLFGTKVFDLLYYAIVYTLLNNQLLKIAFLYMIIIKIFLILIIYPKKMFKEIK